MTLQQEYEMLDKERRFEPRCTTERYYILRAMAEVLKEIRKG